ncbi:MAG TPA: tetratricopeptide repeat protein, partial [Rugosimonospora sp.]|nr:tetratricopeptide repeat protein [Rugosimonospora sp.]
VPAWSSASDEPPPMPDNVHAVIANRLDLLDPGDRAVLQAAAVVGRHFWPAAVAAALGRPVDVVEGALRRLEQRDLIREQPASAVPGQPEYRFRHVLVRDVCYHRLPRADRLARHQRAADWLDGTAGGSAAGGSAADVEALATHRWAAYKLAVEVRADPAGYARAAASAMYRAATTAYARQAPEAAVRWLRRIRDLGGPVAPEVELLDLELALTADRSAFLAGDGPRRLAELGGAPERLVAARAYALLGTVVSARAEALVYLDRAVELYDSLPDSPGKAITLLDLARLHLAGGEYEPAVLAADAAADLAEKLGVDGVPAQARTLAEAARAKV